MKVFISVVQHLELHVSTVRVFYDIYTYIYTFLGLQEEGTKDTKSLEKCEAVFKDRLQNPLSKEESLS